MTEKTLWSWCGHERTPETTAIVKQYGRAAGERCRLCVNERQERYRRARGIPERKIRRWAPIFREVAKLPLRGVHEFESDLPAHSFSSRYNRTKSGMIIRCKFISYERHGKRYVAAVRYE